jgi:HEPN domain-containing protein
MAPVESQIDEDWYGKADEDIRAAEILLAYNALLSVVAFHLQQAVEKCLKGWLLAHGWELERVHDLLHLVNQAAARNDGWATYRDDCRRITQYYFRTRYPLLGPVGRTPSEIKQDLEIVRQIRLAVGELH